MPVVWWINDLVIGDDFLFALVHIVLFSTPYDEAQYDDSQGHGNQDDPDTGAGLMDCLDSCIVDDFGLPCADRAVARVILLVGVLATRESIGGLRNTIIFILVKAVVVNSGRCLGLDMNVG